MPSVAPADDDRAQTDDTYPSGSTPKGIAGRLGREASLVVNLKGRCLGPYQGSQSSANDLIFQQVSVEAMIFPRVAAAKRPAP